MNDDYYGLRLISRTVTDVIFRVKTCNQALVALSDIPGVTTEKTLESKSLHEPHSYAD